MALSMFAATQETIRRKLQGIVATILFPANRENWYVAKGYDKRQDGSIASSPFDNFVETQKTNATERYYDDMSGLDFSERQVNATLSSGKHCKLEVMQAEPMVRTGATQHIVYFPGANTYYQACFRDICAAAKETGATVHAFNYPGTSASTGRVYEANDLINAGMAVVNDLIRQGVDPRQIILQGDCYGAAIALEVQHQYKTQSNLPIRVIANNAFKSFEAAILDLMTELAYVPRQLKSWIKPLLAFTGWDVRPIDRYQGTNPYQCHIQHLGDNTLSTSTLSAAIQEHRDNLKAKAATDGCPQGFRADRDRLDLKHVVRVRLQQKPRLKKFGVDRFGRENAHFADLCELEMLNGDSVYQNYVNDYITSSDSFIASLPSVNQFKLPLPLNSAAFKPISAERAEKLEQAANHVLKHVETQRALQQKQDTLEDVQPVRSSLAIG